MTHVQAVCTMQSVRPASLLHITNHLQLLWMGQKFSEFGTSNSDCMKKDIFVSEGEFEEILDLKVRKLEEKSVKNRN